jgi:hypothetical protein
MLSIPFHFDTPYGRFSDALHVADDHGLTKEQIAALKQQRLDNWIALITAPPPQE